MESVRHLLIALASVALLAAPALAKPSNGHGNGNGNGGGPKFERSEGNESGHGPNINVVITPDDTRVIRGYYSDHSYQAERLPPGIAKNLARGKPLPPGIAKRYVPRDLYARLPSRAGCDWLIVGPNVVLVERSSGVVIDIAIDIF